jgi:hypothetical protein
LTSSREYMDASDPGCQCAQPQVPPPQTGRWGAAQLSRDWPETPTIPGVESSFARLVPWQVGQLGGRLAVTSASKGASQSRHWYS